MKLLLSLLLSVSVAEAGWLRACYDWVTGKYDLSRNIAIKERIVYYNDVEVTSDLHSLTDLLRSLGLTPGRRYDNQKVTSMGEGFSSLAPYIIFQGAGEMNLVDPIYAIRNIDYSHAVEAHTMDTYFRLRANFIAAPLTKTGLHSRSQDLVISHSLQDLHFLNILGIGRVAEVIDESIRIAKVGGEIRHFGLTGQQMIPISQYLSRAYPGIRFTWRGVIRDSRFSRKAEYGGERLLTIHVHTLLKKDPNVARPGSPNIMM